MSWYYSTLFVVILSLVIPLDAEAKKKIVVAMSNETQTLVEVKEAIDENSLVIQALDAINQKDFNNAKKIYGILYSKIGSKDYLNELLPLTMYLGKYDEAISLSQGWLKKNGDDNDIVRFLVNAYIGKKDYNKAKVELVKILATSKHSKDFDTAGNIALITHDYENARRWFITAYNLVPTEEGAEKVATVMYEYLTMKEEAIAFIETHIRFQGCSKRLCYRLAEMYASQNKLDEMLNVYRKLYDKYKEKESASKIVQIYLLKNSSKELISFLKKSKFDDTLLLEAYKSTKQYTEASKLSMKLYKQTKSSDYLAQSAIFTFEEATLHGKRASKEIVNEVIKSLETALTINDDDVYQNYIGYLLIDYNINVIKGIEWVKKALVHDNDNPAYLDSLAWGYFKRGECREGYEIIKKVKEQLKHDKTVQDHFLALKACYEKSVKNKLLRDKIHDFR